MTKIKKEYLIIGSNNFWYASCLKSLAEVKAEIKKIKKEKSWYADPESGYEPDLPEKLYIYKAEETKQVEV